MAEPEPRAPESQARTTRTPNRDPRLGEALSTEQRAFEGGAEAVYRTGEASAEAGRGLSRAGAEAGRRMAETGVRAMDRGAEMWRQSLFPLTTLSYEMNRLFEEFWRHAMPNVGSTSLSQIGTPGASMMQGLMGLPMSDLHETPDSYHISVELAGLRPEDLEVFQDGDSLVVRGEKHDQHREERGGFRVNERRFGRFERRFHLPRDADRENIRAEFSNGLLEIRAPRRPEHEHDRRRIEVKAECEPGKAGSGQGQVKRG
jgi:HSP20 family protein